MSSELPHIAASSTQLAEPYRRTIEWLTRLQRITAALASATTTTEVGGIIIEEALPSLSAVIGVVAVLEPDGRTLTNLRFQGVSAETQNDWRSYSIDSPVPVAEAARRGHPILVGTRLERNTRYPALAALHGADQGGGLAAYPLVQGDRIIGSLGFCFDEDRVFDAHEQAYIKTIAQQCAAALSRIQDQEARKASEQKLQQSQDVLSVAMAQLQLISDMAPIYIASCDRNHTFKFVNKAYATRLGLRPGDIIGRHVREILGEQGYAMVVPSINRVLDGELVDFTLEIPIPHAGRRWMECRYVPEVDDNGQTQGWVAAVLDVTERKQAEEALRKRERELSLIYRNVSDIIFLLAVEDNARFRFVSVNLAFLKATGLDESSIAGKLVSEVIPEPSYSLVASKYQQAIRERNTVTWDETTLYPSGEKTGVVTVTPLFDSRGACTNLVGAVHDVTELKRAASALREADRRKDEFLAMLAHELRNPLGPIRNGVYLLRKLGNEPQSQSRIFDMIERQSTHMSRIVDDLLDVSRITRGKILLRQEDLDLCELLATTAHDYESQFQQKNVALNVSTPEQTIHIRGDRTRIAQSIGNLLHNAQKFTPAGGTTTVTLDQEGNEARITVVDDGIGMDQATLSRLFIPFAQAEQSLERSAGGLGLGLSLVQGLIKLHGGSVTAHSDGIGRGSTLQLKLPLSRSAARAVPGPTKTALQKLRKILIIEDNADAAESLQLLLTLQGHTVCIVNNGPEALELLSAQRPEIIICDIGLPGGMSGYDVAKAVRARPQFAKTFMVALTGYGQEDDQRAAIVSGFDVHLTKPVDPEKLNALIS